MTMASSGDYALLPEPFYFSPSIVKFNNRVYQCVVSNNDNEFIIGKWELLSPDNRNLNALDRIIGYYQPTVNMPGVDLTQLVSGITYPNSTYLGNAFAPADEYTLDTVLTDQTFYPTGLNGQSITFKGSTYFIASNSSDYSSINTSTVSNWTINRLSNTPINITAIIYTGGTNGKFILSSNNTATPILVSDDGINWAATSLYNSNDPILLDSSGVTLNCVTYSNVAEINVAVGSSIITSLTQPNDNVPYLWDETFTFTNGFTNEFNSVAYVSTAGFTGFIAVGLGQTAISGTSASTNIGIIYSSIDGFTWNQVAFTNTTFSLNSIVGNSQTIVIVGDNGKIYTSFNGTTWFPQTSPVATNLNNIIWSEYYQKFVIVGDNGVILTAPINGITWTQQTSNVTENLYGSYSENTSGTLTVVGYNNTMLRSTNSTTWTLDNYVNTPEPIYNVEGDSFEAGYGPEELVAGVVSDNITMIVNTRPGTNWDQTIYQNIGYNVVSLEISPTSGTQTQYSFVNAVTTPIQLGVFMIDYTTGLSTTMVLSSDYEIDWVNKIVILTEPLTYVSSTTHDTLRIDVYEVGNGDQLVKANTETDPLRYNEITGFNEIYVNANYSASIYQGSGLIKPSTSPLTAYALSTNSVNNTIQYDNVDDFVLNGAITFSGNVFGNIVEDQTYYVKSIGYATNRITISDTYNSSTGTAGTIFFLSTASGLMDTIIQTGLGAAWTPPAVYHNGNLLVLGYSATVLRTKASTNTITTITTSGLVVDTPIVFSATIFGGIVHHQTYYIKSIYDTNEFTISETVGGPVFQLQNGTGSAESISNDYSIGISDNGITASLIFAANYDTTVDYLAYSLLGQTFPTQYGYTLPQTQQFVGDGSTTSFALDYYVGEDNPTNAIVEVNGLRQSLTTYTISADDNLILFDTPPNNNDAIAVTSYNLTDRQYFSTSELTSAYTVSAIVSINNVITSTAATIGITSTQAGSATIVTAGSFTTNKQYIIVSLGSTNWNTAAGTSGVTYAVGSLFTAAVVGSGSGTAKLANALLSTADPSLNLVVGESIQFKTTSINAGSFSVGSQYCITSLGNTDWESIASSYDWLSGYPVVGGIFTASAIGSGTGTAVITTVNNISTTGTNYTITAISTNSYHFTIQDEYLVSPTLTTALVSATLIGYAGGSSSVTLTTASASDLSLNSIVRVDGVSGSVQLNNNIYYARPVTATQIELYTQPYNPALYAVNYPVTSVSTYTGGGYVWIDGIFTITNTTATSTNDNGNRITVDSTAILIPNTPVYFTKNPATSGTNILGNILAKHEYYIMEVRPEITAGNFIIGNEYEITSIGTTNWNAIGYVGTPVTLGTFVATGIGSGTGTANGLQEFTISETAYPFQEQVQLVTATGSVYVTQYEQVNVDRLWVTINGYRVPSSSLRLNSYNNLSILSEITTGDEVIITSMMPTASPNEETYLLNVSQQGDGVVYRANHQTRTWLIQPLETLQDTIYLNDVTRVTNSIVQNVTTPALTNGTFNIGLTSNKNVICYIQVYNNTTELSLDSANFAIVLVNTAPILEIQPIGVSVGDSLTITTVEGRLLYINGEQIGFNECDLVANTVSQLTRGANGTGAQTYIPVYAEAFGLIPSNRMSDVLYNETWNPIPGIYDAVDGDPLQIADTQGAIFLRTDIT